MCTTLCQGARNGKNKTSDYFLMIDFLWVFKPTHWTQHLLNALIQTHSYRLKEEWVWGAECGRMWMGWMKCSVRKVLYTCYSKKKWSGLLNLVHLSKTENTEGRAALSKVKHRALNYTIKGLIYVTGKIKRILNNLANIPKLLRAKEIITNNDDEPKRDTIKADLGPEVKTCMQDNSDQ